MPNTGRMNLLEEMGRIDSEKMNKNRRAEKDRVMSADAALERQQMADQSKRNDFGRNFKKN